MIKVTVFENPDKFSNIVRHTAGEVIFKRGDTGTVMYGVCEGEVDIRIGERVIETISPGGIFGEMSLIDDSPRMADAVARTECRIVPVDELLFNTLVMQERGFAIEVMRAITFRLRRETMPDD